MADDLPGLLVECQFALGISQKELGELLGRDRRTLQRWHNNKHGYLLPSEAQPLVAALRPGHPALAARVLACVSKDVTPAQAAPAGPPPLAPYLFYEDVAGAARFLCDAFGFGLGFTSPDPAGGLAHAQLLHGNAVIMLGHAGGGGLNLVKKAGALPALHAAVYVFVDDVDAHCAHARAVGAQVLLEPADQPWGDRMYCAKDPEGQFWMFAKRLG